MEKDQSAANGTNHDDVENQDNADTMDEESAAKQKLNASTDPTKIKFTSVNMLDSKNGEAKVDIHVVQTSIGMGKEELMKYANDPFWVRLRMTLFILFWVGWIAMLVAAVVIIMVAPRCPPAPKLEWYQKTSMYQVDVKSFKDGDGDGVGDLKGLISKLGYFSNINVKTLLLNAIYSMSPSTGGILNYTTIDSRYGTMTDFDNLVVELKKRDMKLVLDFVPNHTSDEHPWFQKSVQNVEPYKNYYVWVDPVDGDKPPNNWLSVDGKSSWAWNEERKQFYLNMFGEHKPDLNLRNEQVRQELLDVMKFWLSKEVDGFKIKAASHLIENPRLRDEPLGVPKKVSNPKYEEVSHVHTLDQSENMELFVEWRDLLTNYSESSGSPKILMAELSGHINDTIKYYGNSSYTLVDFPLNTELTKLNQMSLAYELKESVEVWMNSTPHYAWPNWVLGSEHTARLADRIGEELVDGLYMVVTLLRGTPISYFGDELGMTSHAVIRKGTTIIEPMLWTNASGGGFTNSSNFNLLEGSHSYVVEAALKDKRSHVEIISRLNELRNQPAINFGSQIFPVVTDSIFSLMRVRKGSPGYLVAFNMGSNTTVIDFSGTSEHLPEAARVEIRSGNIESGPLMDGDHPKIKLNNVVLGSKQSVVFSFVPKFSD